jgi:hypothetical protein
MRKHLALVLLLILTALILPQAGRAQDDVQLMDLEVDLWPEYDQPDMLVIYHITLQPEVAMPSTLTFRIPKVARNPIVAVRDEEDGNLYEIGKTLQPGSEWLEVTFEVTSAIFQIEYYDPRLIKQGPSRSFEFTWPGDYPVVSASIIAQQPLEASDMQFSPEDVSSFTGENSLRYYALQIGTLRKDQTYSFSLSYQKRSETLTADEMEVHPADKLPESMWNRGLPWALGVLALVLIAGGVFIYWRSGLPLAGEKKRKRRKAAAQANGDTAAEDSGVYCHRCGRRAGLSDVFCRSCGTKLRI